MMRNKMKKTLCAILASSFMITNSILSISAYAAGFPTAVNPSVTEESSISPSESMSEEGNTSTTALTESTEIALDDAISWFREHGNTAQTTTVSTAESSIDYYEDDYYDTDGNATLIKEEKIIYNSEEMQFIAVTTKDGSVFYVLINYSAEGDEDNVYFLNKVDDYDLYALLYQDNEESGDENGNTSRSEAAAQAANRATNGKSGGNAAVTTTATAQTEQVEQTQTTSSSMNNSMLLLIAGLVVLAGGGFAVFQFTKNKSKKKSSTDDFDGFDDEFDDIMTGDDSEGKA